MTNRQHILVDMDGVLCDWSGLFEARLLEHYPHLDFPFLRENKTWDMGRGVDDPGREAINAIKALKGFYWDLAPIPGGKEALEEMVAMGYDVSICTSPWVPNETCASDKLNWLEHHIGKGWGDRAIITGDKTVVRGDFLIDDRPEIKGIYPPEWEHLVFDATYNRGITDGRRRMNNWSEWKDLIVWNGSSESEASSLLGKTL
jgi:5'-nucleotidase